MSKSINGNTIYAILSMALLVIQGTAMSIVLRFSRINNDADGHYLPSVSVCIAEIIKLFLCLLIQPFSSSPSKNKSMQSSSPIITTSSMISKDTSTTNKAIKTKKHEEQESLLPVSMPPKSSPANTPRNTNGTAPWLSLSMHHHRLPRLFRDALPMLVPASMFVFQQILLIWAATFLDAVSYQIFNQSFKLVPTAVFAYLILGQTLSSLQWASMPVLAAGVIFVTINNNSNNSGNATGSDDIVVTVVSNTEWYLGMIACSISGLSSAFAGVYFEKYLKGKHGASLLERNIQLGIFGAPLSVIYAWVKDGDTIQKKGWLHGFTPAAWGVVGLQVFGGLVIGMVIKYCDNVLKNFSLAVSVILTVLLAIPLFGQWPSAYFLVGVALVILSVFMYSESISKLYGMTLLVDLWKGRRRRVTLSMLGNIAVTVLFIAGTGALLSSWKAMQWQEQQQQQDDNGGYLSMRLVTREGWDGGI